MKLTVDVPSPTLKMAELLAKIHDKTLNDCIVSCIEEVVGLQLAQIVGLQAVVADYAKRHKYSLDD